MIRYLCFFCLFFLVNILFTSPIFPNDIKIQRALDNGKVNFCITQDKDGLLWIGTEGTGLFYYNGKDFKKFKITSKNIYQIISSVFTDKSGTIWFVATKYGLYSYDKNSGLCKNYRYQQNDLNSITSDDVNWLPNIITEDKDGLIWVGTKDGLNSLDKKTGKFTQYKHNPKDPNSLSNSSIWCVFVDSKGLIWIATEDGLNCYNKNTNQFSCYKHDPHNSNSLSSNFVTAIAEDKNGNLWVGTKNDGMNKLNRGTGVFTRYKHDPSNYNSLCCDEIHLIMVDRTNTLWICNDGDVEFGIDRYNPATNIFTHYSYDPENPNSISSNNIMYAFEDRSGTVWLADATLGNINKCFSKKNIIKAYYHNPKDPSSISSDDIAKIYRDNKNNIWIATFKGGLCLYKNSKFETYKHTANDPLSLPTESSVYSLLDAGNKLWMGVYGSGSIYLFDIDKKQVVKSFKNPYSNLSPCYLTSDNKNPDILWFASLYEGGLFNVNTITGEFKSYTHDTENMYSVSRENTYSILQDGNFLWIATGGDGLCKFDKTSGQCIYYRHDSKNKSSISGDIVIESFIDSKGNFWVTTDDAGLNKFDKQTWKFIHFGKEVGFPNDSTRHVLEDNDGYLWISTDSGIVKFDPINGKVVKLFTTADGLPCNQFDKMANPLKDSDGNFWFSGLKGICKFNPEEVNKLVPNQHISSVVLSSFNSKKGTCNEDGTRTLTEIRLPFSDNSFKFTFAVLDYLEPEKNQYAYKLEGFDKNWNYIGTNNFGQYSNLFPGNYTLHLRGSNNDGLWNDTGTSINIVIIAPFWMRWWFITGVLLILIGLGFIYCRRKTKSLKKKKVAERNKNVAEAAFKVAHDLRKPFNQMVTLLENISDLTPARLKKLAPELWRIIRYSDGLLLDIMAAAGQKRHGKMTNNNLLTALDLAIRDVSSRFYKKKVDFYYRLETIPLIKMDDLMIYRAFDNIIANAFDCIPEKGAFMWFSVVEVENEKKKTNFAKITIGNSHSNIPKNMTKKIFSTGITLNKNEGTGLGLYITQTIINAHEGKITARNVQKPPTFVPEELPEVGGVEFIITLPLTSERGKELENKPPQNSREIKTSYESVEQKEFYAELSNTNLLKKKLEGLATKPTLLVVDDEDIFLAKIKDMLEKMGNFEKLLDIHYSQSNSEAMELLKKTKMDYIICDITSANEKTEGTGFILLSEALKQNPYCKVLIHTNSNEPTDIDKAHQLGAAGCCHKSISENMLINLLLDKELWPDWRKTTEN